MVGKSVRGILGLLNALALVNYARGVRRAYGRDVALWYTALQASQFHIWYYMSRTLPNMFAFGISEFVQTSFLSTAYGEGKSKILKLWGTHRHICALLPPASSARYA